MRKIIENPYAPYAAGNPVSNSAMFFGHADLIRFHALIRSGDAFESAISNGDAQQVLRAIAENSVALSGRCHCLQDDLAS